jgi:hypothetical protein
MLSPNQYEFTQSTATDRNGFFELPALAGKLGALACCLVFACVLTACDMAGEAESEPEKPLSSDTTAVESKSAETDSVEPDSAEPGTVKSDFAQFGSADVVPMQPVPVKIVENNGAYQLYRGGQPYQINGAGLENADMRVFVSHGGNSIRTWRTEYADSTAKELLDEAFNLGVTVTLCIEIGRERLGFDYDDEAAVAEQLEYARSEVLKYKDHPALLTWMIGNEPNHSFKNPKVFNAINDISKMIHSLDKNHPTTTALAGFNAELAELSETRMPDLDFISIQMYGDIVNLPKILKEIGYTQPYMVTEWGSIGHWEVGTTSWGAPIEQNSTDKAANYLKSHQVAIASDPQRVLGNYVFLWGQKQERTPTWYGMLLPDGAETETIDVMQYIWTGSWPENRSPQIKMTQLDKRTPAENIEVLSGQTYTASVEAMDPDSEDLVYVWEIKHESQATQEGGDKEEIPAIVSGLISNPDTAVIELVAPADEGAYRLFVYVYDSSGNAAHANIPFFVKASG